MLLPCRNDPNYDSDEERSVLMAANSSHSRVQAEVAAYKQEVRLPCICTQPPNIGQFPKYIL
jgi:hypothetical protein